MKFLERLRLYDPSVIIKEADVPLPPGVEGDNVDSQPTPQEVQQDSSDEAQADQTTIQKLSPESEVLLIRLLKKAFVIQPRPEDIEQMTDLDDINETNARESLQKIIGLMKKYSTDIDIEVD
jgi:hypothetical protein